MSPLTKVVLLTLAISGGLFLLLRDCRFELEDIPTQAVR